MPDTKKTFDSISSRYDLINNIISFGTHLKWKKDFVNLLEFDGEVLDIATGTGDIAIMVKDRYPHTRVTGLDPSEEMLKIANSRKGERGKIRFVEGYCEKIPFPDSSFDFVTITFGIRNTVSVVDSVKEIGRVLKKDGHLLIMEHTKNESVSFIVKLLYKIYLHSFIPLVGFFFGKLYEYKYLVSSIESFYTPKEVNNILEKNGFKVKSNIGYNLGLITIHIANNIKP